MRAGLIGAPHTDHLLIGLGDQPHLTAQDLRALITAHSGADAAKISIPYQGGTRGNPIVVPAELRPHLLADKANPGCAKFTRSKPTLAQRIPTPQRGFFYDIDTPVAFTAFQKTPPHEVTV